MSSRMNATSASVTTRPRYFHVSFMAGNVAQAHDGTQEPFQKFLSCLPSRRRQLARAMSRQRVAHRDDTPVATITRRRRDRAAGPSIRTFERKKKSEDLGDLRSFHRGGRDRIVGPVQPAILNRLRRFALAKDTPLSNNANWVTSSSR